MRVSARQGLVALLILAALAGRNSMGHDTPDWGGKYVDTQFYPLDDLAELAVRLGSMVTYDRRGSVIWQYAFDDGVGDVGPTAVGAASLIRPWTTIWETPPASCGLQAGIVAGNYASIERRVAIPQSKRVGFASSLRLSTYVDTVYHNIYHYDGTHVWTSYLLIDANARTLSVFTQEAGEVVLVDPLPDLHSGYYFSHIKLVVDLTDHSLIRAIFDDREFDLAGYTMDPTPDTSAPNLRVRVNNVAVNLSGSVVNVDNLIITANEP